MIVIEIILALYLGYIVLHNFFFSLVSFVYSEKKLFTKPADTDNRIAVLIPAYKEDNVIISTAQSAQMHDYPPDKFRVVVIADSLRKDTLMKLRATGAEILEVSFEKSTKVKALQYALAHLDDFDIAVILDADNIMEKGFLKAMNHAYTNGYTCLQGRRIAKNHNSKFALLDGISENINNQIFRKGYNAVGLSSSLIGSGMAFPFHLFRQHINSMNSVGGFDRELCLRLIGSGHKIHYVESAVVYDEKVDKPEVFAQQRRRWLSSQFVYLHRYFGAGFRYLLKGNYEFFDAAVLGNLLLPRILTLGILSILVMLYLPLHQYSRLGYAWPVVYWLVYITALLIAVPRKYFNKELFATLTQLPQAFFIMFVNMFRLRNANKSFIHTPHGLATSDSNKPDK